jgi:hypothetical protein
MAYFPAGSLGRACVVFFLLGAVGKSCGGLCLIPEVALLYYMKQAYTTVLRVLHTHRLLASLRLLALLPLLALASSCVTVATNVPTAITNSSAQLGGTATATASTSTITERGVVYSTTNQNPNYYDSPSVSTRVPIAGPGNGPFTQVVTGLLPNTVYYVAAYAAVTDTQQGSGVVTASSMTFTTRGTLAPPAVTAPTNGSTITNNRPTYTGTAPAGSVVTVYVDGNNIGQVAAVGGNFSYPQPSNLSLASHSVFATAQTPADGTSVNSNTNTFTVAAAAPPTVVISSSASDPTSVSPIPFTVTFSEAMTGFTSSDVTVGNGTVTGGSFGGSGATYTFTVTPAASGSVTVNVPSNAAVNASNIGNTAAPQFSITYAQPVVTMPADGSLVNSSSPTYSGTAVAGSTVTVYVDGTAIGTTTATAVGNWAITQPTALAQGSHTVWATAQLSGSAQSANSNTNTFTVDSVQPTVSYSTTATNPTATSPIPLTVVFSESVTGFTSGDVLVGNGTLGSFAGNGTTYTFTITPSANGLVTVDVPANAAIDAAGNGNSAAATPQFSIVFTTATTWTGNVSTDWYTAGNWTGGVPTSTLDAVIPAGAPRYPTITGGTAQVRDFTLNAGSTLTQTAGTLDVKGTWTNNGVFTAPGGTVALTSAGGQAVGGNSLTRFYNLRVNAAGATLAGAATVQRLLTLNGDLATAGQSFTLESVPNLTAMVFNNGGAVVGQATVQRAIDGTLNPGLGYHHFSSPVANTTVADLATPGYAPVVNGAYNSSPTPTLVTPFPTVYGYDQARLALANSTPVFDKGFFSPSALTDPLAVGRGYAANLDAGQVVDFTGTLNAGDVPLALARNSGATAAEAGWQFVGNPYPAPLDWSLIAPADRVNLDGSMYVYQSTSQYGGQYRSFVNGIGGDPRVPVAGGFWVRVSASQTAGTLTLRNSHRLTAYSNVALQRGTTETRPVVQLTLRGATGVAFDDAYVYAETGATTGFDGEFDAEKLPNTTGLNLSAAATGRELAINGLPAFSTGTVVPLNVGVPAAGAYTLQAAQVLNLPAGTAAVIVDAQLGTQTDLAALPATGYAFTVSPTQANALVRGRFFLNLVPAAAPLAAATGRAALTLSLYPNPTASRAATLTGAQAGAKVTVFDALGRLVLTTTATAAGTAQLALPEGAATGVYVVRTGAQVVRLVVE